MQPTVDFDASKLARSLLRRSRQGALATLMPESGDPYCSLVNVASHADASPILLISRLALHTKNILGDNRVSLMLDERAAGDPLEGARIMLGGRAEEATGEAAKILRAFVTGPPGLETGVPPDTANKVERLMFCFLQAGDDEMALKMAERLILLTPDHPDGYAIAGKLLLARHQTPAALQHLEKAVQLNPKSVKANYQLGLLLSRMGKKDEAEKRLEVAKSLRQEDESNSHLQLRLVDPNQ